MADIELPDFTQANLTAINKAIASGALSVEYADKKVTYQSTSDLIKIRELIRGYLGKNNGRSLRVYSCTDKGL